MELGDLRAAYRSALSGERAREASRQRIVRLRQQQEEAQSLVARLQHEAALQREEADDWNGKGFLQLVLRLFGRLDERRDLESAQALAAATRLATAQQVLDGISTAIATERAAMPAPADEAGALERLRAGLAALDPTGYAHLLDLELAGQRANADLEEYDEALLAIERAQSAAALAAERLRSAGNWGTWDIIGGGFVASSIKKERVRDAIEAIGHTTAAISTVRRELADISYGVGIPDGMEMGSSAWTFDVWFDNIFSDLNMQTRIRDTEGRISSLQGHLSSIRAEVVARRASVAAVAAAAVAAATQALTRD